jgi:serine phosphatase RsbU (regulator of sigma subunit)
VFSGAHWNHDGGRRPILRLGLTLFIAWFVKFATGLLFLLKSAPFYGRIALNFMRRVDMQVLIIDDEPGIRTALSRRLGYLGYQVRTAENGLEGLAMASEMPPAIVILDIGMPGMDGFEVLGRLRSLEEGRRIHVLMLTGHSLVDEVERGLVSGADDYLTKPFELRELVARVNAAARLQELQQELRLANADLAHAKADLELILRQRDRLIQKMSLELDMAAKLQQGLQPPMSIRSGNLLINALYQPSSRIGGDLFDVRSQNQDGARTTLLLADAAGHGVSAALLAAMLRMALGEILCNPITPANALEVLNRRFQFCSEIGSFLSVFCAQIEPDSGQLVYCNAGLVPPLLYHKASGEVTALTSAGFCLGIFEDGEYEDCETRLAEGDRLLLFTDGISEASRSGQDDFGCRLPELLAQGADLANDALLDRLSEQLRSYLAPHEPIDDYTLLSIQRVC